MPYTYLEFIDDADLFGVVSDMVSPAMAEKSKLNIHKNVIDPFSALFDSVAQKITVSEWVEQEKARQVQKTLQNRVGHFHQEIIGKISGCRSLGVGSVVDIAVPGKGIVAEIKNKFNTTKGNHKKDIYDDLAAVLGRSDYAGYTGYYVEVIPAGGRAYNTPFTPSDNVTSERRPHNENIRVIDGKSFYSLVTDQETALEQLYSVLPTVIGKVLDLEESKIKAISEDPGLRELFGRAYNLKY